MSNEIKGIGVVQTTEGLVLGEALTGEYEGITTFRSVPYAAPPVGKLRFMPQISSEAAGCSTAAAPSAAVHIM